MSHTIKKDKDKVEDKPLTKVRIKGHRPNKQKLTRDELVKLLSEQGFG